MSKSNKVIKDGFEFTVTQLPNSAWQAFNIFTGEVVGNTKASALKQALSLAQLLEPIHDEIDTECVKMVSEQARLEKINSYYAI